MGFLDRLFGPVVKGEAKVSPSDGGHGHHHAPDADPDDVVLPKTKRSSRSQLGGKPPVGWERHSVESTGGFWPWGGGSSDGGSGHGGSDSGGGGGSSGGA